MTDIAWMLKNILDEVPSARSVLLVSGDGLPRAGAGAASDINGDQAATQAAAISGLSHLARGFGQVCGAGGVEQLVVRFSGAWLFIDDAGAGTILAVVADGQVDPGQVGFEMNKLIRALEPHLRTAPRSPDLSRLAGTFPAQASPS